MKDIFRITIRNFFKENENFDKKTFLLNVYDEILLEKSNKSSTYSSVYFKIFISKIILLNNFFSASKTASL